MNFKEAIEKFTTWMSFSKRQSTRSTYRINLLQFGLYMRNCNIETIELQDILSYLEQMRDLGWDHNNFMVKCITLKKFFAFYKKQGVTNLDSDLIPQMENEYKFPKVATLEDYEKVLATIPDSNDPRHIRNKTMLMLYKDTGMRLNECIGLDIEHVNTDKMCALIKTEKTKKLHPIRMVFWTKPTNDQLERWLTKRKGVANADPQALFLCVTGVKIGKRITDSGVTEMLRRYSHEAKLDHVLNSHSLRHLFGRTLAEQGVEDSAIATMLGHAHVDSSRPYTIMAGNKMEEFYEKFVRKTPK